MPRPVVRSPLGLPLGDGGCYPSRTPSLVLAPGWWPGGLIPYLKDVGYRYRGVQPDGDRGGISGPCHLAHIRLTHRTAPLQSSGQLYIPPRTLAHVTGRGVVVGAPRACPRHRPSPPPRHRASARAGAPHMHPSGPFPPAHLDACHEDPVLEAPRRPAGSRLSTRPAADAGPWRRAAQALPACERGKGRRRGWGEGQWAGEAARSGCGR